MIIKVCGMREALNIRLVEQLQIDWMGFIFYPDSPRYVKEKPSYLPSRVKRVGVFVNAEKDFILNCTETFGLDMLQLHGMETPKQCSELRRLTGRKIIVDTYGGSAPHGGGAFSGKDPTKVDRSAAYAARYVAKNVVASGLADRCQVQLAYAIGVAKPVSVLVETFGTGKVEDAVLSDAVNKVFDLRPSAIIRDLDLRKPIYRSLASYGHIGREDLSVRWEETDRTEQLLKAVNG